jgi:hypothetical protein
MGSWLLAATQHSSSSSSSKTQTGRVKAAHLKRTVTDAFAV